MVRLVFRAAGSPDHTEVDLAPGVYQIGRDPANEIVVEDDSVSARHCEITVAPEGAVVRDLDSTNGIQVDGQLVAEAILRHGQTLQVGNVPFRVESAERISGANSTAVPPMPPSGVSMCSNHPEAPAEWLCPRCHRLLCTACLVPRQVHDKSLNFCPQCGGHCVPFGLQVGSPTKQAGSFYAQVPGAFGYPLRGDGLALLICGTLFFAVLNAFSGRAGVLGLLVAIFSGGYLFAFVQSVLVTSAQGAERTPSWPDFSNWWEDIIRPYLLFLGLFALCFGPAIGFALVAADQAETSGQAAWGPLAAAIGLGIAGALYLPMALLGVSMADGLAGVNPLLVMPSILRIPLEYGTVCGFLLLALAVNYGGQWALNLVRIPILTGLLSWFVFLYLLVVAMRLLGVMYWACRDRLAWV